MRVVSSFVASDLKCRSTQGRKSAIGEGIAIVSSPHWTKQEPVSATVFNVTRPPRNKMEVPSAHSFDLAGTAANFSNSRASQSVLDSANLRPSSIEPRRGIVRRMEPSARSRSKYRRALRFRAIINGTSRPRTSSTLLDGSGFACLAKESNSTRQVEYMAENLQQILERYIASEPTRVHLSEGTGRCNRWAWL
ncbi:MAG: hypothetical protein JWM99_5109 [Verrucomicrobiales bacterium]|nr:hypothetical protein [Verrucomicrobiales bacterium]